MFNCETNVEGAKAKWLKNEETIFESSKYMISQRDNVFSLRIRDGQKSDEACYTVSLTNHRGEHAKCSASAKVAGNQQHFIISSCNVRRGYSRSGLSCGTMGNQQVRE